LNIFAEAEAIPGYKKTVIFGGDSYSPPYEYLDNDNRPKGYCVDITMAIAEELGWDAQINLSSWTDIINDLNSGKIHIIEREVFSQVKSKFYEYSLPYHEFRYFIYINNSDRESFNINRLGDMTAVVQKNSITHEFIKINLPYSHITEKDRIQDVLLLLSAGKNSFTVLNKYTEQALMQESGIKNFTSAGEPLNTEQYHYISLKKNRELIAAVNEGLNVLKNNGRLKDINERWFGVIENKRYQGMPIITALLIFFIIVILYLIWLITSQNKKIKKQQTFPSEQNIKVFQSGEISDRNINPEFIIADAPIGIFTFNNQGVITVCNDTLAVILNTTKEKITGKKILSHHDGKLAELVSSAMRGEPGYYEGDYSADNKTVHIRYMHIPFINGEKSVTGGIGILEDITKRKKYEESLVAAKDTAESASNIKSHFLANMSHEVRTPLNGILGMLQLLQTTGINEEQSNYISIAIKSGMRLTRLLNDILELSRVEADKLVLNETQFSLKNILNFIEERYITECDEKGVKLFFNIDDNTPDEIIGDEIRIRQILINLVSNSVKYTKTGQINVDIRTEDISLYGAVNIIISVKDTGIGIAEDMLTRIFEPFKQEESLYRRSFQGAGLGLTLVKHLVNIMNGSIKIESTPGKGTFIECTITVKHPENQAIDIKPVSNKEQDKSADQFTILIAEDERINRLALKRILEKTGYRILEAENGIEVLKILETENPDCILMDIQMPEMNGIETTKILRDREKYGDKSGIPVIALTAYTLPEDREKIKAAGLDDFISKPVNMDYLIKSITKLVVNV
jgi:two-component system sensor histidine kinase EvgS